MEKKKTDSAASVTSKTLIKPPPFATSFKQIAMPCGAAALQLSLPTCAFNKSSRKPLNFRHCRFRTVASSSSQDGDVNDENRAGNGRNQRQTHVILLERYGNGTAKRYVVDDELQVQTFVEDELIGSVSDSSGSSHFNNEKLSWLPDIVKDFIFPAGFPGSVSDDYLLYMLLQFPTNVTAWICHTLVTSSLLKAVGVGSFSGSTAAASAAAIRWIFLFVFCVFNFHGIIRASYVQLLGFESRDLPET